LSKGRVSVTANPDTDHQGLGVHGSRAAHFCGDQPCSKLLRLPSGLRCCWPLPLPRMAMGALGGEAMAGVAGGGLLSAGAGGGVARPAVVAAAASPMRRWLAINLSWWSAGAVVVGAAVAARAGAQVLARAGVQVGARRAGVAAAGVTAVPVGAGVMVGPAATAAGMGQ